MRCRASKLNICRLIAAFMAVLTVAAFMMPMVYAAESGKAGNVKWEFADGTLTVSGNGAMDNYAENSHAPWYEFASEIRVLKIERGVTSIGNYAFKDCNAITSVTIADSVTSIGKYAFADCSSIKMISFGSGLRTIGESAFENCIGLQTLRIPDGVTSLGRKAFYRCDGLRSLTVPKSVTSMGSMVFARCNGLMSADMRASVSTLPLWTFYGCDLLVDVTLSSSITAIGQKAFYNCNNLKNVYYLGPASSMAAVEESIREFLPNPKNMKIYNSEASEGQSQTATSAYQKDEETTVIETVTVKETSNATVSTTVRVEATQNSQNEVVLSEPTVSVDAVIENKNGWDELADAVKYAQTKAEESSSKIEVSVNYNSDDDIKGGALSELSGKDASVIINMNNGSTVKIDCNRLEGAEISDNYKMSHLLTAITKLTDKQAEVLGDADSYKLSFSGDTEFDFSPKVYVGTDRAHSCATLYQIVDGELKKIQSVIVDKSGNATFYLQSAYKNSEYVIAIDVEGVDRKTAIIPEELYADYGITDSLEQIIEYIPTEERKFLGMNIAQFSFFIFGTIGVLVVGFGVTMGIFYRKKRLEMFYRMKMEDENNNNP